MWWYLPYLDLNGGKFEAFIILLQLFLLSLQHQYLIVKKPGLTLHRLVPFSRIIKDELEHISLYSSHLTKPSILLKFHHRISNSHKIGAFFPKKFFQSDCAFLPPCQYIYLRPVSFFPNIMKLKTLAESKMVNWCIPQIGCSHLPNVNIAFCMDWPNAISVHKNNKKN